MTTLEKYELNYDRALEHFESNLGEATKLGDEILKTVDFRNGSFFAIFPKDSKIDNIHSLMTCLIFYDNYRLFHEENSLNVPEMLFNSIHNSSNTYCVFDDFHAERKHLHNDDSLLDKTHFNNDQVYYIHDKKNTSIDSLNLCLSHSFVNWHSLCILTTADLEVREQELSAEVLHEIALHTQLIVLVSYDGDGYAFWQKAGQNYL